MFDRNRFFGVIAGASLALSSGQAVNACAFHGYTPNPTLVDVILATEHAVVARPTQSNGNGYSVERTLVGPPIDSLPTPVSIDTRAKLAADPSAAVFLARDGAYGPWLELAVLDDRFQNMVQRVARKQSTWLLGREADRVAFFAKRVNDPSPAVRRLALQELDRASYADLKSVRLPNVPSLQQDIETGDPDLRPIRVLLAGLSGDRDLTAMLTVKLDNAVRDDVAYLGAFATALVELEGQAAVELILNTYITDRNQPTTTQDKLLQALALQYKTARPQMRRAIARDVAALVRTHPHLSDAAAREFGFKGRR